MRTSTRLDIENYNKLNNICINENTKKNKIINELIDKLIEGKITFKTVRKINSKKQISFNFPDDKKAKFDKILYRYGYSVQKGILCLIIPYIEKYYKHLYDSNK